LPQTGGTQPDQEIAMLRRIIVSLFILTLATAATACSDTWRGVKDDTGDNLRKTGDAISK
jgi:predicted small secreted protein